MRIGGAIAFAAAVSSLVVSSAAAVNITTDVVMPKAEVNGPYEFQFEATEGCGPYRFSVSSGTVPPGFRLLGDGRLLGSGTQSGTFTFTVSVSDLSANCPSEPARGAFTLDVLPDLAITTPSLPTAAIGVPYRATLAVSGRDSTSVRWTIVDGGLPSGLGLGQDGVISGTPTAAGTAGFVIKLEEPFRRQDLRYMTLAVASALTASPLAARAGEVGVPYSAALAQTGGVPPVRWTIVDGSLPRGLLLDRTTGVITGRPLTAGSSSVTFQVADAAGTASTTTVSFRLAARLRLGPTRLSPAVFGAAYAARLRARGGVGPVRWKVTRGSLPPGIRLDATGRISGSPHAVGTHRATVRATDALGVSSTARVTLVVV
jgi:hypothetical protein